MSADPTIREQGYIYFLTEAPELLQLIQQELLSLPEERSTSKVHSLMRATHTIKGGAANVGLEVIKTVAHYLEDVVKALYNPELVIDAELQTLLLEGYECLRLPLMAELTGNTINENEVLDRAASVFAQLQAKLGDYFNAHAAIPSSVELGFDIVRSLFEIGVTQRLQSIATALNQASSLSTPNSSLPTPNSSLPTPNSSLPTPNSSLLTLLRSQAEVFVGLAESLNLPGFGAIAQTTLAALDAHPTQVLKIAEIALSDFLQARTLVLAGDRTRGGEPSLALQELAQPFNYNTNSDNQEANSSSSTFLTQHLESKLEQFYNFLTGGSIANSSQHCHPQKRIKPLQPKVAEFYLQIIRCILGWFYHEVGVPQENLCLSLLVPPAKQSNLLQAENDVKDLEDWLGRFFEFIEDEQDSPSLSLYRRGMILIALLGVAQFQELEEPDSLATDRKSLVMQILHTRVREVAAEYKKYAPVNNQEKNWIEAAKLQNLLIVKNPPGGTDEFNDILVEKIWGGQNPQESDSIQIHTNQDREELVVPSQLSVEENNGQPTTDGTDHRQDACATLIHESLQGGGISQEESVVSGQSSVVSGQWSDATDNRQQTTDNRQQTTDNKHETPSLPRQSVRVDLEGLNRLNHLAGEMLINQNRQNLQDEQLKQALGQLLEYLRRHEQTLNQLRDCSEVTQWNAPRQWSAVSGQSSVVSGQWSVVSGQWSVVSGQMQRTTDNRQPPLFPPLTKMKGGVGQQTTDNRQPPLFPPLGKGMKGGVGQQTTDNRQPPLFPPLGKGMKGGVGQQTTDNRQPTTDNRQRSAKFDSLELEQYTEFNLLLHSALEETLQLQEATESIELLLGLSSHTLEKQQRLLSSMRDDLMEARMLPLGNILSRFTQMVQQLGSAHGKLVELRLRGTEVLVDKAIAEKLYDPLLHLVRNAFDHGIESPEVRRQCGKPEKGLIEICAYYQGSQTFIEVRDDGKGLDLERIHRRAVELNLLSPEPVGSAFPTEAELLELLFEPGFSTTPQLSDLSGRGIGLDIVRSQLQALKGSVTVQSSPGRGTSFLLQFPFSMMTAKLLLVQARGAVYGLLLESVEKILLANSSQIKYFEGKKVLHWCTENDECLVSVRQLSDLMHYNGSVVSGQWSVVSGNRQRTTNGTYGSVVSRQSSVVSGNGQLTTDNGQPTSSLLLLRRNTELLALEVEQILGEQELVVRPVGSAIAPPKYVYGCSILGDGRLILVIDGAVLVSGEMQQTTALMLPPTTDPANPKTLPLPVEVVPSQPLFAPSTTAIQTRPSLSLPQLVLVVDDALSIRQTLTLTLQKSGYQVLQAQDGLEALEHLRQGVEVAAVICDLEMPRLNGFEFLSNIRQDTTLADLPVIILTSRSAEKHRQLAQELGATAYFTKPYLDREFVATLASAINNYFEISG